MRAARPGTRHPALSLRPLPDAQRGSQWPLVPGLPSPRAACSEDASTVMAAGDGGVAFTHSMVAWEPALDGGGRSAAASLLQTGSQILITHPPCPWHRSLVDSQPQETETEPARVLTRRCRNL